mmetsp:Transcript_1797/g.1520  ORF Transcript_1797/g.1520 Transcript_1797/m.1520 type:complete len:358 (+) Transcript_1797:15-1088(+)
MTDSEEPQDTEQADQQQTEHQTEDDIDINIDIDIDIDADVEINNDENLFGPDDDDNNTMKDLFGSDDDDNDNNNDENKSDEEDKVLSRKYIRSVPEGKKTTISSSIALSELPNNDKFEFCILRLPNVIDCDIEPFDDKQYIPSSTSSSIDNYIRWRAHYESATDETFKESNTKLVFWKDGTKSLIIGKDCYDIDQQILNGNRDYIYYNINDNQTNYKLSHSKINKRLNVRTTTQKSYKTLQKNLAKKHERTKGSKQLTALQRRHNRNKHNQQQQQQQQQQQYHQITNKRRISKKRSLKESFLEEGGHGNNTSDDDDDNYNVYNSPSSKRHKRSSSDESDESESDSDDDDQPIGSRLN